MPKPSATKSHSLLSLLALSAIGCAATDSHAAPKAQLQARQQAQLLPQADKEVRMPGAKELRAQGPTGLGIALARFDALEEGAAKEQQAKLVDEVAAQRYATVSRLFWHTDLAKAKAAASDSGKPILSLRMLGRLDEDYSCANSRLFRTVLYANHTVSSYLRDNFTLHWSSEREVPKVTIDFGDGRTMRTTMGGNSAHYVLDQHGRPVDVLPGLYGPKSFVKALQPARKLAVDAAKSKNGRALVRAFHVARAAKNNARFSKLTKKQQAALAPYRTRELGVEIISAEMLTVSKAVIEMPVVRLASLSADPAKAPDSNTVKASVTSIEELDSSSKKLIASMATDWASQPKQASPGALSVVFADLEKRVAGDTLINQYALQPMVTRLFARGMGEDFEQLNKVIYSDVFVTPRSDAWLGMAQPGGFTGLPADGLSVKQ
jgi:hypothetical protein